MRISAILGGGFTTISNNKVRDTNLDVSLCESAYSDFIFLEGRVVTPSEMDKIQKGFMATKDTSGTSSPQSIFYEYTIFEEKNVENSDSKIMEYVGVLQDNSPTNTVVMFADSFTER